MQNNMWKIACVVLVLFCLWLGFCRKPRTPASDLVAKSDSLVNKVKQDSIDRVLDSMNFLAHTTQLKLQNVELTAKLNNSEAKVFQWQGKINLLINQLQAAKQKPFDSSFIYVAPDYIDACDSLAIAANAQGKQLEQAKIDKDELIDLMNYEVVLRDSMIEAQRDDYNILRADFNAQTHYFKSAIKQGKPRAKVFAGISALGNNITPLGGGEVSGMLVTKKEKVIELGTGFYNHDWYVRAGVKIKISFK